MMSFYNVVEDTELKMPRILITGPQGSGKTTQAQFVADFLSVPLIGTGEILRKISQEGSSLGELVRQTLDTGHLVDDTIVAKLVEQRIAEEGAKGFVMDGYPRSLNQIKIFDPKFDKVFYLDVPDDVVIERMVKRGRIDDIEKLIRQRLELYHQLTEPVLSYYTKLGILTRIASLGSIDETKELIMENLKDG